MPTARDRSPLATLSDQGGVASVLIAVCFMALVTSAAAAIDAGSLYMSSRQLQGMADLAAMSAAQNLGDPQAAASATIAANPWPGAVAAHVVTGAYATDPSRFPAGRFQAGVANPSAVQVTLTAPAPVIFAGLVLGRSAVNLTRVATAAHAQFASFSVGSGLASIQGGVANSVLSALTGSSVALSAVDYTSLTGARIDLFEYIGALKTRASLQGASFSQVLSTSITVPIVLLALSDTLTKQGNTTAATAAQALAAASAGMTPVQLCGLFDLGPYMNQDHVAGASNAQIALFAMDFADAVLILANGQRVLSLDLGAAAPGLADIKAWLAVGQRPSQSPWMRVTNDSLVVSTAQARLYLDAQATDANPLLVSVLGAAPIDMPLFVQLASAQAALSSVQCAPASPPGSTLLMVSPSLGELALGQVDATTLPDFTRPVVTAPATLASVPILSATATSQVNIGGGGWQPIAFSSADIQATALKSAYTSDVAQASVASLVQSTSVQIQTFGLGIGLNRTLLAQSFQSSLSTAAPSLDQVLSALEAVLGVKLGEADVRVNGLRCNSSALVG